MTTSAIGASEPSGRSRIRDAAIACFARDGFSVTVRDIAVAAGVTAGLITHHFGSKQALRAECDAVVLERIVAIKHDGVRAPVGEKVAILGMLDGHAREVAYAVRCVQEGGGAGRVFLERMIAAAVDYLAEAVASGQIRPSRDPVARARLLVTQQIGGVIARLCLNGDVAELSEGATSLQALAADAALPTLEIYTEGLLTDRQLLEQFLTTRQDLR